MYNIIENKGAFTLFNVVQEFKQKRFKSGLKRLTDLAAFIIN